MKDELERFKVAKARKEAAIETAKTLSDGVKGIFGQSSKDKTIKALRTQINDLQRLQFENQVKSIHDLEQVQQQAAKSVSAKEREYSAALAEARRQRDEAYQQSKGATEAIQFHKNRGKFLTDVICSLWKSAIDAVNVLCYYLRYTHLEVSFSRDQVDKIDKAMQGAKTIEEREEYGRNLMKLAQSQYPNYNEDSRRFKEVQGAVEEVARKENRHQQSQSRGRGWHL